MESEMAKRKMSADPQLSPYLESPEPPAYGSFPKRQNQGRGDQGGIDFAGLYAKGESPKGFVAQTANGTARDMGTGQNKQWGGWNEPQVREEGAWQRPFSNRTGE
jgi:hypothetical protein